MQVGEEVLGTAAKVEVSKESTTIVGDGSSEVSFVRVHRRSWPDVRTTTSGIEWLGTVLGVVTPMRSGFRMSIDAEVPNK